jgi:serine/threonine protein kinase
VPTCIRRETAHRGRILGDADGCPYELVAPIGSGGFAQVFRGVHRDTGHVAAIKIQNDSPIAMARFRREIDVLSWLDHPHVMPILEADPAGRWYAMPLADCTLSELRSRDPLDWESLRDALSSVCGAMLHMHAHELVHRDASPRNVLRLRTGLWVLADYGLVRRPRGSESLTKTGMRFGTPQFSAPEVHHDPRDLVMLVSQLDVADLTQQLLADERGERGRNR